MEEGSIEEAPCKEFYFIYCFFSSPSLSCNEWHEEESGKRPVLSKATLPKSMITMEREIECQKMVDILIGYFSGTTNLDGQRSHCCW